MPKLGCTMGLTALLAGAGACGSTTENQAPVGNTTEALQAQTEDEGGLPDTVIEWNIHLDDAVTTAGTDPGQSAHIASAVQVAVFDAVNGIDGRYAQIHVKHTHDAPPRRAATVRAAAARAAHDVLVHMLPAQQSDLDAKLAASLASLDNGSAGREARIAAGSSWGANVASQINTWRDGDHFNDAPPPYTFTDEPGRYQLTPGAPPFAPVNRNWITTEPYAVKDPLKFSTPGPRALTSHRYAVDVNEIQVMGVATGSGRTQDQSDLATFWMGITVPPFDSIARQVMATRCISLLDEARTLALLEIATTDVNIQVFTDKNYWDTWRPYTAITEADTDGNPATVKDAGWEPFLFTPPFQEYPAGHAEIAGAGTEALEELFGNHIDVTVETVTLPGKPRHYSKLSDIRKEMEDARVFGGMHFRSSCEDGTASGQELAHWVVSHVAQ